MTERDLIRRLETNPVPPPPEDLAARIIKDIPSELELHPSIEQDQHRVRFQRRPIWLAAAAVVTVALTGAVTWELRRERPSFETMGFPSSRQETSRPDETAGGTERSFVMKEVDQSGGRQVKDDLDGGILTEMIPEDEGSAGDSPEAATGKDRSEKKARNVQRVVIADHFPAAEPTPGVFGQPQAAPGPELGAAAPAPPRKRKTEIVSNNTWVETSELAKIGEEAAVADMRVVQQPGAGIAPEENRVSGDEEAFRNAPASREFNDVIEVEAPVSPAKAEQQASRFSNEIVVEGETPLVDVTSTVTGSVFRTNEVKVEGKKSKGRPAQPSPSTGGTAEPNNQPFGDVFFEHTGVNPFVDTEDDRFSTFGLDVDTGSFTIARQYLNQGHLPPRAAIRVEEFVNAFDYGDAPPRRDDFRLIAEGAPSVFAASDRTYTLRLAVKAREVDAASRPPVVLVFCIDVSGSMDRQNRLGLVKQALHELLGSLRRDDYVGLVVYGSSGRVVLKPTTDHGEIERAIDQLSAGGSTNAEEGLLLAYDLLSDGDDDGRIRRVILCSDGVANVGETGPDAILKRIRREAADGIELTSVGFGMGNYNDVLMERLADAGDGRYAYVDVIGEARRIFVEELTGTLLTLGHDAKAQVEFDPDVVSRYRLLGYENRDIADHLFRDPTVDAGEIGAGHTVTAVYEVKLRPEAARRGRVATLRLRYRSMDGGAELELNETLRVSGLARDWEKASPALKLASLVAEFAEILKGAYWAKDGDLDTILRRLQRLQSEAFRGDGQVAELGVMVARAKAIQRD